MSIFSQPFLFYKNRIFPKIKDRRGATRLKILLQKISWLGLEKIDSKPNPIAEEEWDNLIILDACRADIYNEMYESDSKRITMESNSYGFVRKNFSNYDFSDTVCITGNPFYSQTKFNLATDKNPEDVFHTVFHTYGDKWDSEENTVLPEAIVEDAKTAENLFPKKKKILHFMQPHIPFVGKDYTDFNFKDAITEGEKGNKTWDLAMKGEIPREKLVNDYKENLKLVMDNIEELVEELGGKTVITADHGTFLGENRLYKHPGGCDARVLREVPWDIRD
jgi:hypothetical protein